MIAAGSLSPTGCQIRNSSLNIGSEMWWRENATAYVRCRNRDTMCYEVTGNYHIVFHLLPQFVRTEETCRREHRMCECNVSTLTVTLGRNALNVWKDNQRNTAFVHKRLPYAPRQRTLKISHREFSSESSRGTLGSVHEEQLELLLPAM